MPKVFGFDIAQELESLFYGILRWTGSIVHPQLVQKAPTKARNTNNFNVSQSEYYSWRPAWNALTDAERASWEKLFLFHRRRPYGNFVINNQYRKELGMSQVNTPDVVPYPCGYLFIPTGINDVEITFRVRYPYFTFHKSYLFNKRVVPYEITNEFTDPIPSDIWGNYLDLTTNAGFYIRNTLKMYFKNNVGATYTTTNEFDGEFDPTVYGGPYPLDWNFQMGGGDNGDYPPSGYDTLTGFDIILKFHNVHGKFFFRKAYVYNAQGFRDPNQPYWPDIVMGDIGKIYTGNLASVKVPWSLTLGGTGVIFKTDLPAHNGLT